MFAWMFRESVGGRFGDGQGWIISQGRLDGENVNDRRSDRVARPGSGVFRGDPVTMRPIRRQALREVTPRRPAPCDSTRIGPFASVGSIHGAISVTTVRDSEVSLSIVEQGGELSQEKRPE